MLASRKPPLTTVNAATNQTMTPGAKINRRPATKNSAPGSRISLTIRTGSDRDGTMLAAAGPDWSAEVTRLTIQVPVNAVTSHTGVPGSCATATADSAVTSATCDATSQR